LHEALVAVPMRTYSLELYVCRCKTPLVVPNPEEVRLIDRIQKMLERFDYLLPLVAADFQYRQHYYRLNAAALLEDLFFDAFGTHLRQTEPKVSASRAIAGAKSWDYEIDGLRTSHKMSKKGNEISVHWDATAKRDSWSADHPIVVGLSENIPHTLHFVSQNGEKSRGIPLRRDQWSKLEEGKVIQIVGGSWTRLESGLQFSVSFVKQLSNVQPFEHSIPFSEVWNEVGRHLDAGGRCNDFDLLKFNNSKHVFDVGEILNCLDEPLLSGFHLFPTALLQNVPLSSNNRSGSLISKQRVRECMHVCQRSGLFAPMPLWFSMYAEDRPPNLYSTQRKELDELFGARLSW